MLHDNPGLEAKKREKADDYLPSGKLITVALTKDPGPLGYVSSPQP